MSFPAKAGFAHLLSFCCNGTRDIETGLLKAREMTQSVARALCPVPKADITRLTLKDAKTQCKCETQRHVFSEIAQVLFSGSELSLGPGYGVG